MPRLKNPRHEMFCQEWIRQNFSLIRAYMTVYPKATRVSAHYAAQKLKGRPEVRARLEELRDKFLDGYEMGIKEIAAMFSDIARADMKEIVDFNSCTLQDLETIDGRLIKEIKRNDDGTFSVKLYDKLQALRHLGSHKGMFRDAEGEEQAAVLKKILLETVAARDALKNLPDMTNEKKSEK